MFINRFGISFQITYRTVFGNFIFRINNIYRLLHKNRINFYKKKYVTIKLYV